LHIVTVTDDTTAETIEQLIGEARALLVKVDDLAQRCPAVSGPVDLECRLEEARCADGGAVWGRFHVAYSRCDYLFSLRGESEPRALAAVPETSIRTHTPWNLEQERLVEETILGDPHARADEKQYMRERQERRAKFAARHMAVGS
jgi:hypothetical protein